MKDCPTREMTLEEEIDSLEIPKNEKERLIKKLYNEHSEKECEFEERMRKLNYKLMDANHKCDKLREQNVSLKSACFDLAAALKQQYEL